MLNTSNGQPEFRVAGAVRALRGTHILEIARQ
jgi:hypothetical protein